VDRRAATSTDTFAVHGVVTRLIGRDRELGVLRSLLQRATAYQAPQFVTVLGNQGVGKSRLLSELMTTAGEGTRVFHGTATGPTSRYSAIVRLLRDRFGIAEGTDDDAAHQRLRDAVQEVFSDRRVGEVLHFLGSFLGLRYRDSPFLRTFDDNARQHDEIARAVLRRFLEVDAARSPLVLVFDDVEKADDDTLTLLEDLGQGLAGSPVMIVACARPELLVRRPQWGNEAGDATRLELRNLERAEAGELLKGLLSRCDKVPFPLIDDAVEMTGGNPLFLEELVRVFLVNGTIDTATTPWKLDAVRASETELPISIEQAIEARIAALAPEEVDLLEKGAVFGNVFWCGAVLSLSRLERTISDRGKTPPPPPIGWAADEATAAMLRRVDTLVERDYLLRMPPQDSTIPGDTEIVFKHNLERELVERRTEAGRKRRLSIWAAQWWETKITDRSRASDTLPDGGIGSSEAGADQLEFLASLYERGGDRGRAARAYLLAGDRARLRYANTQAVDHYRKALVMLDWDDALLRMEGLHNLGSVLALVGKPDDASVQFQEMLRTAWLLDHPAKGGAAHGRIGRIYRGRGDHERALEHFRLANDLFERASDMRGLAGAADDIGAVHYLRGAYETALEYHKKALAIRRNLGDKRSIALSLANLGRVHHDSGGFAAAMQHFHEALELRRDIGDRPGVVSSMCDLGTVHEGDGKFEAALEIFTDALRLARDIGDRTGESKVLGRLGEVELALGKTAAAVEHLGAALEISQTLGDRLAQAECARRLAEVFLVLGDVVKSYEYARRSLELAQKVGSRVHIGMSQRVLAEVLAAGGGSSSESLRVDDLFRAAMQTLAECHNELELARCYRSLASVRERAGQHADAVHLRMKADEIFGRLHRASAR
jgi:tetratricopeptide (TPR) repeat protein